VNVPLEEMRVALGIVTRIWASEVVDMLQSERVEMCDRPVVFLLFYEGAE
jgi:hypothetical protein